MTAAIALLSLTGVLTSCNQYSPVEPALITPPPTLTMEDLPTIDFLEFPSKGEVYDYATIKIKASKPGAYSLSLIDENAKSSNPDGITYADRVYNLGTILTEENGIGSWHFKVDNDFELDRVQIRYIEEERSYLIIDTIVF